MSLLVKRVDQLLMSVCLRCLRAEILVQTSVLDFKHLLSGLLATNDAWHAQLIGAGGLDAG